jgi:hypothetical protein
MATIDASKMPAGVRPPSRACRPPPCRPSWTRHRPGESGPAPCRRAGPGSRRPAGPGCRRPAPPACPGCAGPGCPATRHPPCARGALDVLAVRHLPLLRHRGVRGIMPTDRRRRATARRGQGLSRCGRRAPACPDPTSRGAACGARRVPGAASGALRGRSPRGARTRRRGGAPNDRVRRRRTGRRAAAGTRARAPPRGRRPR